MNFVAIDFETANEKRHSPCSLGITVVRDGMIIDEKYWLIRPKEMRFAPMNIMIHGIRPGDVADAKTFDELWPELLPYLEGQLVVAHNASFDMSVLRNTLDLYDIPYPTFDYCCTLIMSKLFYPFLDNAKLNTVSHFLGHELNHHHASSDATACTKILLSIGEELGTKDILTIGEKIGFQLGKVYERDYRTCSRSGGTEISKRALAHKPQMAVVNAKTDYFEGKLVAFTGPLGSMARHEAIKIIEQLGGDYTPSVTLKTNLVITNVKDPYSLSPDQMSTKMRRAMTLIERGQKIDFLTEEAFLSLIR